VTAPPNAKTRFSRCGRDRQRCHSPWSTEEQEAASLGINFDGPDGAVVRGRRDEPALDRASDAGASFAFGATGAGASSAVGALFGASASGALFGAHEKADSLGSAVLVAACGAFVAVLRNHAKIVRAHANRESPKPAARPLSVGSHSLSRCSHGGLSLGRVDGARKPFPRRERLDGRYAGYRVGMGATLKHGANRGEGTRVAALRGDLPAACGRGSLRVMCPQRACGCTGLATMLCQYGHARPLSPDSRWPAM
jgi:hypothetical protein